MHNRPPSPPVWPRLLSMLPRRTLHYFAMRYAGVLRPWKKERGELVNILTPHHEAAMHTEAIKSLEKLIQTEAAENGKHDDGP